MNIVKESLKLHKKLKGKLEVRSKIMLRSRRDLSLAYTPGVAAASLAIAKNPKKIYDYTIKNNSVAVVTNGSAVLGLGNIGARAAIPVMEGKAILFKEFAEIDAFPIAIDSQNISEIVSTIRTIAPVFGGINIEDIKAPECFIIEEQLQNLGIPVMHDDQHGTAVVVLAALQNATKVVKKSLKNVRIVINGAGAAGTAITFMLLAYGVPGKNIMVLDSKGIIYNGRKNLNDYKKRIALKTNDQELKGPLSQALVNAEVCIGVSKKGAITKAMVRTMAKNPIIIAMANPYPEIMPKDAKQAGAAVVATGRSDFPNQVNNVLAFPGIFRGALDARATKITNKMKLASAKALSAIIKHPQSNRIIPSPLDKSVVRVIARAIKQAST